MLQTVLNTPVRIQQMAQANSLHALAAYADWCIANLYRRTGDLSSAHQYLDRAQATYQTANDIVGVATCLMTRADWQCAPFSTPLAWNFALQDSSSEGSHLSVSLEAKEFASPSPDAIANARIVYAEAEQLFQQAHALRGLAAIHLRYGYLAMLPDDYRVAVHHTEQARDGFAHCGDWRGYYTAQTHLVMSRLGTGQFTETPTLATSVGAWGATQGSFSFVLGLGILLNRCARHWLIRKGDYERALAGYRAAQALFAALGATANVAQSIVDQGVVYQAIGERATALTLYEHALDLYSQDIEERARVADNLRQRAIMLAANVYQLSLQQMDTDGMERSATRLKAQVAQLPGGEADADTLLSALANQLSEQMSGKSDAASQELPAGIEFWSLRHLAQSLIEQASVLVPLYRSRQAKDAGDNTHAEHYVAEATAALPQVSEAQRHFLTVSVLAEQQRFHEAAEAVRQHLHHGGADAGFVGDLTKVMTTFGGEHGQAEARLQQRRTHEQALSVFVRVKAYAAAKSHLDALEQLAGQDWWAQDTKPWQPLSDCAELYEGLDDLPTALAYYDQAIAQLEAHRRQLSRDELKTALAADKSAQYLYFQAARAALKQQDWARAFDYTERGKARSLLDLLAGSAAVARAPESESAAMRAWRQLNAQLTLQRGLLAQERGRLELDTARVARLTRQIDEEEAQLRTIEAELARSHPNFQQAVSVEAKTLSLDQVAAALPPDALLLEYFFLGDDLLAWAIDRNGLAQAIGVSLDARALARDIRTFHRACERRAPIEPVASHLAEVLLTPLAKTIHSYAQLIIVPYGPAHTLPFHALPIDGQPLATIHTLSYLPSASALQYLRRAVSSSLPDRILAIGNPTKDLPAAATEAAFVASLFDQEALLGDHATEEAVCQQISQYPLLHFATHGRLSEDAPLSSSLALANGEELSVYELMGLRLNADLVVMSACNTGQGETTGGDDVLGLTRGLLGAGARAAVVSLWQVDDVSTSLFMGKFYRRLRAGDAAAVALQAAQTYLRNLTPDDIATELAELTSSLEKARAEAVAFQPVAKERSARHGRPAGTSAAPNDYSHPYYWAPFILVG
jgi:CHAT domain-containing protein